MNRWEILTELIRAAKDPQRIGDVAILKSELGHVRGYPEIEAQLEDVRGHHPPIDLERLHTHDKDSFGYHFAEFMHKNKLQSIVPTSQIPSEIVARNALNARYATIHDMVHVLLGYDTSWVGECGVWGFIGGQRLCSQFQWAAWMAILVAPFRCPFRILEAYRTWKEGWKRGQESKTIIAIPLEDYFSRPLTEVQSDVLHPSL